MSLILPTPFAMHLLRCKFRHCWVVNPFFHHHPDAWTGPFALPVPAILAVPLQPHLLSCTLAQQCGSPRTPILPSTFAVDIASVAVRVLLLPA